MWSHLRDLKKTVPRSNVARQKLTQAARAHFGRGTEAERQLQHAFEPMALPIKTPQRIAQILDSLEAIPVGDLSTSELQTLSGLTAETRSAAGTPTPMHATAPDLRPALVQFANQLAGGMQGPGAQLGRPSDTFLKFVQWVAGQCTPENPLGEHRYSTGPRQTGLELVVACAEYATILEGSGIVISGGHEMQQLAAQAQAYRAAQMHNEVVGQQLRLLGVLDGLDQKIGLGLQQHQQHTAEILYGDRSTPHDTIGREPPTMGR
jgi:hypothetical protein